MHNILAFALFAAALWSSSAFAGSETFNATELATFVKGKSISFTGGGTANYHSDGSYVYRGAGRAYKGKWYLNGDMVCITFNNGNQRCDRYGKDGDTYFAINQRGERIDAYRVK